MKAVKKSFFRFFDKAILLLLGSFGMFSACNLIETPVEYGMPHADFELKGIVTDDATSQPIKNIRVIRPHFLESEYDHLPPEYKLFGDTVYTDENGKYIFEYNGMGKQYQLKFEDIDGMENGGLFQPKEIEGKFTQADQVKKGSGWYEGKFAKTQDVALDQMCCVPEYGVLSTSFRP